jgi:translation initiation factor IF-2
MTNDQGRRIKEATPSTPVEITGLHDIPQAGDQFKVFADEKKARAISEARAARRKQEEQQATSRVSLDELFKQIQEGEIKEINVILKADVQGSVEALKAALEKLDVEGVRVRIIHSGVGAITESDVSLATASNAIVIGFNVRPQPQAKQLAEQEKVDIRLHRIIYDVTEEMEKAMKGMLDPEYREKVIGTVEVRQIFKVSKVGTIAGSYVREGKVTRDSLIRLIRDGIVIHEGKINALKRFKDDVREVSQGYECGITIENYNDIKEGDVIEAYVMEEVEHV